MLRPVALDLLDAKRLGLRAVFVRYVFSLKPDVDQRVVFLIPVLRREERNFAASNRRQRQDQLRVIAAPRRHELVAAEPGVSHVSVFGFPDAQTLEDATRRQLDCRVVVRVALANRLGLERVSGPVDHLKDAGVMVGHHLEGVGLAVLVKRHPELSPDLIRVFRFVIQTVLR